MKRYVKASTGGAILTSVDGNFSLVQESGIGMQDTPWTGYKVKRSKLADTYVVDVRIDNRWSDFNGEPVEYEPRRCEVSYGMRMAHNTVSDIRQFIALLEEAISFKQKLDDYFSSQYDDYDPED